MSPSAISPRPRRWPWPFSRPSSPTSRRSRNWAGLPGGACSFRVPYDHNLLHLQASNLESVKWERIVSEGTKGGGWHALGYRETPAEALAVKARYEQLPEVSMVIEAATLVPPDQDAKLPLLADIRHRLRQLPARGEPIRHLRPNSDSVVEELESLITSLAPLHSTPPPGLLRDLRDSLMELRSRLIETNPRNVADDRLLLFDQNLAGDLAENLHRLLDVSTPAPIT